MGGEGVLQFLIFFWQGEEGGLGIFWSLWLSLNKHVELAKCHLIINEYDVLTHIFVSALSFHYFTHAEIILKCKISSKKVNLISKSRIRETKNLSTDADSKTNTILEGLCDSSKKKK